MIKWPSIDQFRNVITHFKSMAQKLNKSLPTVKYHGTVKLHGTNAGILTNGVDVWYQSRENIITPEKDNAGFANYFTQQEQDNQLVTQLFNQVKAECAKLSIPTENKIIAIYGEWCGGNIQGGANLALAKLPKMFVIFGIRVIDSFEVKDDGNIIYKEKYLPRDNLINIQMNECQVYNSLQFPTFEVDIDFAQPQLIQNKLIELTLEVEQQCPVGAYFKVDGVGEGIVWAPMNNEWVNANTLFKTKGEKHSPTKVKKLVEVDVERINSINEFIDMTITDSRLQQGIDKLKEQCIPVDDKATGAFIKWVIGDVIKEEKDRMITSNISDKDLGKFGATKARQFFLNYINDQ